MRETFKIDLSRPVTNRRGEKQSFITLNEPTLEDILECGKTTEMVFGREVFQEVIAWPVVKLYLKRLLVDVSPEILGAQGHPHDADKIVAALAPFMNGAPPSASAPSASSPSASG